MNLHGWKYEGRKISDKLHEQILAIVDILNDSSKVAGRHWPEIQKNISDELGIATGQVRTIKRMMEELDIVKKGVLNARDVPDPKFIYTENGRTFVELIATEKLMRENINANNLETMKEIGNIYKLYYQKVLAGYSYNAQGNILHPLRATLKALSRYDYLSFLEWYLLNTIIQNDNDEDEEAELDRSINDYRKGKLSLTESDIVENSLSHSYVLGNFEYAGLVHTEGSKFKLRITINPDAKKIVDEIIK